MAARRHPVQYPRHRLTTASSRHRSRNHVTESGPTLKLQIDAPMFVKAPFGRDIRRA
jgi:hypothetical protein